MENFVILQSTGIIVIKKCEIMAIIYACRYSRGLLGIKMSTRISAGVDDCPCFTISFCYDSYWLQNYKFFLTLVFNT